MPEKLLTLTYQGILYVCLTHFHCQSIQWVLQLSEVKETAFSLSGFHPGLLFVSGMQQRSPLGLHHTFITMSYMFSTLSNAGSERSYSNSYCWEDSGNQFLACFILRLKAVLASVSLFVGKHQNLGGFIYLFISIFAPTLSFKNALGSVQQEIQS